MIQEYITFISKNRGYSQHTVENYRRDLGEFAKWIRQQRTGARWSNITAQDMDEYVRNLCDLGYAPASIKRRVSAVRSIYNYMRSQYLIKVNPAQYTSTPKLAKREPHTVEVQAITSVMTDSQVSLTTRVQIAILAETGIRISELMSLHVEDVDELHRQLHITGKGNKERTVIYGECTAKMWATYKGHATGLIFTEDVRTASRNIHFALAKHSGQKYLSPHIIRHTYATEMVRNGASIYTVRDLLGHESVKTTEQYAKRCQVGSAQQYLQYAPVV